MSVKFFCDNCGREIFQELAAEVKETTSIESMESQCICSDCLLLEARREKESCLDSE